MHGSGQELPKLRRAVLLHGTGAAFTLRLFCDVLHTPKLFLPFPHLSLSTTLSSSEKYTQKKAFFSLLFFLSRVFSLPPAHDRY